MSSMDKGEWHGYNCGYHISKVCPMKMASVKEVKDKLSQYLKRAEKEDIVITRNGEPTAVLHHLGDDDLEDYLLEHDPKFRRKIERRWKEYLKRGGTSAEEMLNGPRK